MKKNIITSLNSGLAKKRNFFSTSSVFFKAGLFQKFFSKNLATNFLFKKNNFSLFSLHKKIKKNKYLVPYLKKSYLKRFKKQLPRVFYRNFKKKIGIKNYNCKKFKISHKTESLLQFNLNIIVKKNNVFCTFFDLKKKKTVKVCSSGIYKIKVSKKTLRYTYDLVLAKFYRDIKKKVYPKKKIKKKRGLFVTIICSQRLRKKVARSIRLNFKKTTLLIKASHNKVFNGCRPPKKVRKKRRSMRIYK